MIKACIFDLDGTLANTLESMAYVANEILKSMNLKNHSRWKTLNITVGKGRICSFAAV